jgi:hypothetical protein
MGKSNSMPPAGHYNVNYGNFQTERYGPSVASLHSFVTPQAENGARRLSSVGQ